MRQLWMAWLVTAGVWMTLCGCGGSAAPQAAGGPETGPAAESASKSAANSTDPNAVTVNVQSWDETEKLIARNLGKVVVIDLWTSW